MRREEESRAEASRAEERRGKQSRAVERREMERELSTNFYLILICFLQKKIHNMIVICDLQDTPNFAI